MTFRRRPTRQKYVESKMPNIRFCGKLSRIFFKQLRSGSLLLNLCMQFVYVVGHRENKYLG